MNECYLGYSFEKAYNEYQITETEKNIIKQKCVLFTKHLIYEIRARLPSNLQILQI